MAEPEEHYTHSPEDVRLGLSRSLKALNCEKVDMFYLHGPDRVVSLEDTLRTVNELHQKGLFNRFGISNFQSWEVARLVEICDRNRWVRPVVYQGIYNALHRSIEPELIPCLRHYGIQLYAFQPLAGGFLTGRYRRDTSESEFEPGSRFDPKIPHSALHRGRYWNEAYFDAIEMIHGVAEKHGLTVAQVALRWLEHHSLMREGDAIIVGASSVRHTESNLKDLEGGELPEEVVRVVDEAWLKVKAIAPKYWH
jgi:aflatoxin B1 aldehyde reductase